MTIKRWMFLQVFLVLLVFTTQNMETGHAFSSIYGTLSGQQLKRQVFTSNGVWVHPHPGVDLDLKLTLIGRNSADEIYHSKFGNLASSKDGKGGFLSQADHLILEKKVSVDQNQSVYVAKALENSQFSHYRDGVVIVEWWE